ncbi:DHA2 family efflux MFS transporter permease subunit [Streptomyces ipomoeae]|uniref:Drug resistance MFS transporter, drug:H+ antiporter-2 (14 Spanner) (DHA2) family protein n=2 Tax=Streptomyces ipomoeae TaxID=103232 RepID=L1L6Z5_9ACTN|nr:MFS transporter [Streptomyces ipomoeae]EKX68574.1 drug resistance MFS transporter, drug:H+ antiporter-2 (14 Spanner) (DHA2) family protein [Streptomyces ipomoeae 91-03]MDX2695906.1 MFS transporter [Streptomyces ipomoeae]MDX2823675.1 MFS transporter [Streptomyces ipomoeae]MDX2841759.1 MFS transporter [Streptomyces ipomoeae]MDX2876275.1 MFS transporter [Streptomyces ipomoeae]
MTTSPLIQDQKPGAARREGHPGIALTVIAACQLMVVLDATIVNLALPHIQDALKFSTTDLTWVVSAYTLTFGGLLLLGGRAGDILGRRRVFMTGILLFTLASLLGGLAQEPWQLLAARALQGAGGAIASPTSLALITTTFPEGPERNRAFGVFAAVSAGGGAIGLLAGGMLTEWLDWRWVLFVNVPIGVLIAVLTPMYINESERHPGRFDIAGALTSTAGMASLVYGFIRAAEDGWRDGLALGSFGAAAVLLVAFGFIESRAKEPITPLRMFADRNRSGTYVIMLSLAAAMFGMFFFIVLFVQNVLQYTPIEAGLAFLPVTVAIVTGAGLSQRFLPVLGPKPFMVGGSTLVALGLVWQTFISPDSSYLGGVLGPMLMFGFGMGLNFVTLTLTAVSGVAPHEAGAASGLLNATQQVGGSLGLSILTTVFGTASRDEAEKQVQHFMANGTAEQKAEFAKTQQLPAPWSHEVLAQGIATAFVPAVAMAVLALATAALVIRVRKSDLDALAGTAGPGVGG